MELQGNWKIFPFLQNHQKKFILLFKNSAQSQIKTLPWVECFYICQLFRWNKVGSPHYEGYQKASTKLTSPKAVAKLTLTCHKIFSSFPSLFSFLQLTKYFLSQNICIRLIFWYSSHPKTKYLSYAQIWLLFHLLRSPNIFEIFCFLGRWSGIYIVY